MTGITEVIVGVGAVLALVAKAREIFDELNDGDGDEFERRLSSLILGNGTVKEAEVVDAEERRRRIEAGLP